MAYQIPILWQVINVYEPKYESAGSYWPFLFRNIIIALLINHITIIGILSLKQMEKSTFFLVPLPCFTIIFFIFCCQKFLPGFKKYPLEVTTSPAKTCELEVLNRIGQRTDLHMLSCYSFFKLEFMVWPVRDMRAVPRAICDVYLSCSLRRLQL